MWVSRQNRSQHADQKFRVVQKDQPDIQCPDGQLSQSRIRDFHKVFTSGQKDFRAGLLCLTPQKLEVAPGVVVMIREWAKTLVWNARCEGCESSAKSFRVSDSAESEPDMAGGLFEGQRFSFGIHKLLRLKRCSQDRSGGESADFPDDPINLLIRCQFAPGDEEDVSASQLR